MPALVGGFLAHAFRDLHGWNDAWAWLAAVLVLALAALVRVLLRRNARGGLDVWRPTRPTLRIAPIAIAVAAATAGVLSALYLGGGEAVKAGRLSERLYVWEPESGPMPALTDVTAAWGLDQWTHESTYAFGGATAIGDLDGDGWADIVAGGVELAVFFGHAEGFERAVGRPATPRAEVTSLGLGDLDRDGALDLMLGRTGQSDVVVWGGEWTGMRDISVAEVTEFSSDAATTGFAVADFDGDGSFDLLRVGYGKRGGEATEDIIYKQIEPRSFAALPLPESDRLSLAAEVADVDDDGLADIWITRDIGWIAGADSVYSRRGNATGEWVDIAPDLDVDLEIDGMGVTIADLTGDGELDVYITDVGENEFLVATQDGYELETDHGAGRIRPVGAPNARVSSSWGGGVADLNLDGRSDLIMTNGATQAFLNKIEDTDILVDDPPAVFLGLGGGRFADVWPDLGLRWTGSSRGMALGDVDRDGDTDLAIVNYGEGLRIYRNDTTGRSLTVQLAGTECASAGATVSIDAEGRLHRRVLTAHTFLGVHAYEATVGVGTADLAQVSVAIPGFQPNNVQVQLSEERTLLEVDCPVAVR